MVMPDTRGGMIGRVYAWNGGYWRVVTRWAGKGAPRNVLIERVEPEADHSIADVYAAGGRALRRSGGRWWKATGERMVRPFRGLRRIPTEGGEK